MSAAGGDDDGWGTPQDHNEPDTACGDFGGNDSGAFEGGDAFGGGDDFVGGDEFASLSISNDAPFDPSTLKAREEFGFNFKTFGVHIVDGLTDDEAWKLMKNIAHSSEPDITKFKEAFVTYCKALYEKEQEMSPAAMEDTMRSEDWPIHLIAISRPIVPSYTIVGMDGKPGLMYTLTFQLSSEPKSAKLAQHWPTSHDDNLTRLKQAGFAVASNAVICRNCSAVGHVRANCEAVFERKVITAKCVYCEGNHHARDCPEPRMSKERKDSEAMTCRRCGEEGHIGKDCPEAARSMTCRRCEQEGHMAKDCPEAPRMVCRRCDGEGHMAKDCSEAPPPMTCRRCGQEGHMAKECPEAPAQRSPRDFSKLPTCKNCSKEGHSAIRCPLPPRQLQPVSSSSKENAAPTVAINTEDMEEKW